MTRDGGQVRLRVGRPTQRRNQHDGVPDRRVIDDLRGAQVLVHEADGARPGPVGNLPPLAIGRGNGGAAGQRHAQTLRNCIHGQRCAHRVAVPERRRGGHRKIEKSRLVDLARGQCAARPPDHGSRPYARTLVPAVEHRPARQHDRREIRRERRHEAGGCGLVAAGHQDDTVKRISVQDLDQPEIGEIAVERGRGPPAVLEGRMDREDHGYAARVADAVTDPFREREVDTVARVDVAAGLGDADDRLARAQFLGRDPVVHEALEVERGHVDPLGIVEPVARAKARCVIHRLSPWVVLWR